MIYTNKFLRKNAGAATVALGTAGVASLYEKLSKLLKTTATKTAEYYPKAFGAGMAVSATSAAIAAIALAKLSSPEAIANNADEYVINETMKASLAKSLRDRDKLIKEQAIADNKKKNRLPHDQFV